MAKIIGFNLNTISKKIDQRLIKGINKALGNRSNFIDQISPVDSGDYISRHQIKLAKVEGDYVVGSNFNDSDHAFGVEFGFRKSPVNWSKKDGITIYNGVGANVFQRTTMNPRLQKQAIDLIREALG